MWRGGGIGCGVGRAPWTRVTGSVETAIYSPLFLLYHLIMKRGPTTHMLLELGDIQAIRGYCGMHGDGTERLGLLRADQAATGQSECLVKDVCSFLSALRWIGLD